MTYPTAPDILTDYSALEAAAGDGRFPGVSMDTDFATVKASLGHAIDFLANVIAEDGSLKSALVSRETLAPGIKPSFDPPRAWTPEHTYQPPQTVFHRAKFYICAEAHTAGTFEADLTAGRWQLLADFASSLVLASNNLADLEDVEQARENLGLGDSATLDVGGEPDEIRNNGQNDQTFLQQSKNLADLDDAAAARENLGVSPAAVSGLLSDLIMPDAGIVGRSTPGPGRAERVRLQRPLLLNTDEFGDQELILERATVEDIENALETAGYVTPAVLAGAIDARVRELAGAGIYPDEGPMFMRYDRSMRVRHVMSENGPTLVSGYYRTRPLNFFHSRGLVDAQVQDDTIFLPKGRYFVTGTIVSYQAQNVFSRLHRYKSRPDGETWVSDEATLLTSNAEQGYSSQVSGISQSSTTYLTGQFSLGSASQLKVEQLCQSNGLMGVSGPEDESVYLDLTFFKMGGDDDLGPDTGEVYL